jgi:2-polyprenyl-6-methoxyphenol hydroxylase-like FAD-dependent oxidoreductase
MVLKVLYDGIKDKTKVLTKKRVQNVELTDGGVTVKTADGSAYKGDILIGADGIHSSVRGEMWRLANETLPGWIPSDEHACEYMKAHTIDVH